MRSTVISWLGGTWRAALKATRLPAAPDGDALAVEFGAAFTEEEVLDAIRACAHEFEKVPVAERVLPVDSVARGAQAWTRQVGARGGKGITLGISNCALPGRRLPAIQARDRRHRAAGRTS